MEGSILLVFVPLSRLVSRQINSYGTALNPLFITTYIYLVLLSCKKGDIATVESVVVIFICIT